MSQYSGTQSQVSSLRSHLCNPMVSLDYGVCFLTGSSLLPLSPSGHFSIQWSEKSPEVSHSVTLTIRLAGSARLDNLACVSPAHKFLWTLSFCWHQPLPCLLNTTGFLPLSLLLPGYSPQGFGGFLSFRFFLSHLFNLLHSLASLPVLQMFACIGF